MYLAFRLYGIWDQRRSAIKIIIGSFIVCYAPVVVLAVLAVQEYVRAYHSAWYLLITGTSS